VLSSVVTTLTILLVSLAAKLTVHEAAVKSPPWVALPPAVA
jgi:hypothetical protein